MYILFSSPLTRSVWSKVYFGNHPPVLLLRHYHLPQVARKLLVAKDSLLFNLCITNAAPRLEAKVIMPEKVYIMCCQILASASATHDLEPTIRNSSVIKDCILALQKP